MLKPALPPSDTTARTRVAAPGGRHAGTGRTLAALAAALLLWSPLAAARTDAASEIQYQFQRPSGPGDPFSLRFDVPPDHLPAVLITNRSTEGSEEDAVDFGSTLALPLPVDESGGFTGLDGVLPDEVTLEQLDNSVVEIRLLFLDTDSGEFLLSDPIELRPEETPTEEVEDETSASEEGDDALTAQDLAPSSTDDGDEEIEHVSDENDNPNPNPKSGSSSYVVGSNIINTPLGTMAVRSLTSSAMFSIYDQPTPVQGSGH